MAIAATVPNAITTRLRTNRTLRAITVAAAAATIGVINGATSIAPITTAGESASNPNEAIPADNTINAANRNR